MNRLPFLGLLFALLCLVACRQMNEAHLLHLAEKQVNMNVDSVYALLVQIERPSQLSDEERLLYGWLNAYVHYKRHNSMAEDSLILPASDYYVFRNDTAKNQGLLDSAEYYLNKERKRGEGRNRFLTEENMVAVYRALIDYTRHRTFDVLDVARYNDSVANALTALQSTVRRKDESKETLSQANLILTVERKQAQLNLLLALLVLVLAGGGVSLYIRNRRNRLIEAEERAETLTRLLEDAIRNQSKGEDGQFFRKILLQQLGMIRLVAKQPTSQNQELLRRISGITSHELPVESLLVWEDLYPIIDRIYDNFYTKMDSCFGDVLIDKEKQLCCLLCADFSTKEISVVTQQSIPTIYQRKTNIRKKLGMGEKEGIVEFIGSI